MYLTHTMLELKFQLGTKVPSTKHARHLSFYSKGSYIDNFLSSKDIFITQGVMSLPALPRFAGNFRNHVYLPPPLLFAEEHDKFWAFY